MESSYSDTKAGSIDGNISDLSIVDSLCQTEEAAIVGAIDETIASINVDILVVCCDIDEGWDGFGSLRLPKVLLVIKVDV
jgi:hypothetical protein